MHNIEYLMKIYDEIAPLKLDGILNDILNGHIQLDETRASIRKLKPNKAAGIDGIPSEFYKHAGGNLDAPLTALFNHTFDCGLYPDTWCEGIINPLYKRENPNLPENYRKISITPALGKIFDSILSNRLQYAKECLLVDDPFQNGFKAKTSAVDNIFMLNGIIQKCKLNRRPLYACFVDFKSAFDFVNRSALLSKLYSNGVQGKFLQTLKSMFQNARSKVKWGGKIGELFENAYGVLQGGVLSPTLFRLFLDDMTGYLNRNNGVGIGNININYLLVADDLVLLSESPSGLQNLINGVEKFCSQWHMLVNLTKTKVVLFNNRFAPIQKRGIRFQFNNLPVEEKDCYNYLGAIISNGNRFEQYIEYKRDKALRAIYSSRGLTRDVVGNQLPIHLILKIFDTQIQPILDYGCEIWYNGKSRTRLESVHTTYIKRVLGVKPQTSNPYMVKRADSHFWPDSKSYSYDIGWKSLN